MLRKIQRSLKRQSNFKRKSSNAHKESQTSEKEIPREEGTDKVADGGEAKEVDDVEPPCKKLKKTIAIENTCQNLLVHFEETSELRAHDFEREEDDSEEEELLGYDEGVMGNDAREDKA